MIRYGADYQYAIWKTSAPQVLDKVIAIFKDFEDAKAYVDMQASQGYNCYIVTDNVQNSVHNQLYP